jgi:hypothetical protein
MDQNGLSDPVKIQKSQIYEILEKYIILKCVYYIKYVEIELKPRYIFQNCGKQYTSVIKKNLNPTFNEVFEL